MKIAPTLQAVWFDEQPDDGVTATAELRALLAVVRASDRCETRRAVYVITGDPKHHRAWMLAIERWHRTRDRLEKVSRRKP